MEKRKLLGSGLLLLTALIWGMAFAFQRLGSESIEPFTFNAARSVLAAAAVGPLCLIRRQSVRDEAEARWLRRGTLLGGLCCGAFLTAGSAFQQMGLQYTEAGKGGFISAMYMLLVPIFHFVLFRKKSSWLVWLAVLVGLSGMYLLCITEGFSLSRGDVLVAICALFFAGHILSCDHFARRGDPIRIAAIQFVVAALLSGVLALLFEEPGLDKLAAAAIPILYCGLLSSGAGFTLQLVAQRFTEPTVTALLLSLESVFAVIGGALLLGERMSGRELTGCAVMFAAIVLVQLPAPKRRARRGDRDA